MKQKVFNNTIYEQKSELDQFYTAPSIAQACYDKVCQKYSLDNFDLVLEPSAGSGAFYNLFPKNKRYGLDLEPKCDGVVKMDFFDYIPPSDAKIITIGNPPFGKIASLATKFFNQSAQFSDVIAFVIPKTFKKRSLQNRLDLNFHLVHSEDLPKNSFVLNDEPYDVPCCFQIWEKRARKRKRKVVDLKNEIFDFVSKDEADFAVRRVGGRTGKCQSDLEKAAEVSHYFLKIKKRSIKKRKLMSFIDSLDVAEIINATAGVKSISKPEFVEVFFKNFKE